MKRGGKISTGGWRITGSYCRRWNWTKSGSVPSSGILSPDRGHIFVNETVNITTSIVSTVVDIFLSFAVSLYMLAQKEKLARQAKMVVRAFLPEKKAEGLLSVASLSSRIFSSFVTGQLTEAVILGLCASWA